MNAPNLRVRVARKLMSDINVVPYIDVMLVLLVIFMTTAPMMTQGLSVDLPEANSTPVQPKDEPIVLTVKTDGSFFIDLGDTTEKSTSLKEITQRVTLVMKQKPDTLFLVEGDKKVEYGHVISLMAALQAAGVEKLALVTEPPGN